MPLIRRLPKRGFNNAAFHKTYAIVNLTDLNEFKAGTVVNEQLLREANLVRGNVFGIKLLAGGELKHALKIEIDKVSDSAKAKVDKAGGSVTIRMPRPRATGQKNADDAADGEIEAKTVAPSGKKSKTSSRSKAKKKTSRKG